MDENIKPGLPEEDREHNERWKEHRNRLEKLRQKHLEEQDRAAEEAARKEARRTEIEEAILEIARCQNRLLQELIRIRAKLKD